MTSLERTPVSVPSPAVRQEPVAVIGAACRLPAGVDSAESLWNALLGKRDLIGECDAKGRRSAARAHLDEVELGHYGGYLAEVDKFQPEFFGISPREAAGLDPQHRLLVEVAWEALEHAGMPPRSLAGLQAGVYTSQSQVGYLHRIAVDEREVYHETGAVLSGIAGRVSHVLGLRGPSVAVDGACASSLIAVHLACRALAGGETDVALAGGANIGMDSGGDVSFARAGMLSKTGRCRSFDSRADGFVRSEGAGIVVLKRLSDARRDGDRVLAVVRGSAVNHIGRTASIMRPDAASQAEVIATALERSGIDPDTVGMVESHGTGTLAGDPIEVTALSTAYGRGADTCALGSAKTNTGHTEAAAGVTGFIKAVLAVHEGVIPPNLHFQTWNPDIDTDGARFAVPTEARSWSASGPRRAAVSSFGVTGMNAHVLIEQAEHAPAAPPSAVRPGPATVVLSHSSSGGLAATATRLAAVLGSADGADARGGTAAVPADVAHTLANSRSAEPLRIAFTAADTPELVRRLHEVAAAPERLSAPTVTEAVGTRPDPVWVFSGHGSQWPGMGRTLLETEPVFAAAIDRLEPFALREQDVSLRALITSGSEVTRIDHVQPLVFAVQVALAAVWRARGVRPGAVIGHSMGEAAAAVAAGILTEEQGMQVICRRTRLMRSVAGGTMATVALGAEEVREALAEQGCGKVSPAVLLSPAATVVAGDDAEVTYLENYWRERGVRVTRVPVEVASHTPQVDPILDAVASELAHLAPTAGDVPFYSTVSDDPREPGALDGAYWAANLRRPVRFGDTVMALLANGYRVFLEVSPHPLLSNALHSCAEAARQRVATVPSLLRDRDENVALAEHLGSLFGAGAGIDTALAFPGHRVDLPATAWDRRSYWAEGGDARPAGTHPLLGVHSVVVDLSAPTGERHGWLSDLGTRSHPWLADHRIRGHAILPGTVYVEMAMAAADQVRGANSGPVEIAEISFEQMLALDERTEVHTVATALERGVVEIEVMSRDDDGDGGWTVHARARLQPVEHQAGTVADLPVREADQESGRAATALYTALAGRGLEYGPAFRGVVRLSTDPVTADIRVQVQLPPQAEIRRTHLLGVHPVALDTCLHALTTVIVDDRYTDGDSTWMPQAIRGVRFGLGQRTIAWSRAIVLEAEPERIRGRVDCYDAQGRPLGTIDEVELVRIAGRTTSESASERLHEVTWTPTPLADGMVPLEARRLLVAEAGAEDLVSELGYQLADNGTRSTSFTPRSAGVTDVAREIATELVKADHDPYRAVVVCLSDDDPDAAPDTAQGLARATALTEFVRAVADAPPVVMPRLWIVSRNAQPGDPTRLSPGQHALRGVVRVMAAEHPELRTTLVDVSGTSDAADIAAELGTDSSEDEVAWRDGVRHVARLRRAPIDPAEYPRDLVLERRWDRDGFAVMPAPDRTLNGVRLVDRERRAPAAGEVEIRVRLAALNFRDTLNALGILPGDDTADVPLGGDVLGTVTAVGEGVTHVRSGDRVMACAEAGGFASFVATDAALVRAVPPGLSDEDAATCGYAFLTAHAALAERAGLAEGETVLIHSAASGTGLAAVAIARGIGATVIATAGSEEKRDYLRGLGIEHVFDSRSLDFAAQVEDATGGRGIDVVLNSLAGAAMHASLGLVAPFGRFVELGKRDLYADTKVGLRALRHNATYSSFDLIALIEQHPGRVGASLERLLDAMAQGRIAALPHRTFDVADVGEALRTMTQGHHIGRLLLRMPEEGRAQVSTAPGASRIVRPDGAYLISGGLSGLGLEAARWLTDHGATRIVLTSRSRPSPATQAKLGALRSAGVDVRVVLGDIADPATSAAMTAAGTDGGRSIRGVLHCAGVVDDAPAYALDPERMATTWRPKVDGAMHLHTATAGQPMDWFVLFSSWVATIGGPSQANYAAANAWLDGFARWRKSRGLPALSIGWGVWGEVGLGIHMSERGITPISTDEGFAALEALIPRERADAAMSSLDLDVWFAGFEHAMLLPFFASVSEQTGPATDGSEAAARIAATPPGPQRQTLLEGFVRETVAAVTQQSREDVRPEAEFTDLGLDSLMAVELRNRMRSDLGVALGISAIWSHSSSERLAAHVDSLLETGADADAAPVGAGR